MNVPALLPFAIFLSAFLLFQVQPIIGRFVLPWFGGGPAVWTNCLLFFQTVLLAGYAYAHWTSVRLTPRRQAIFHICLLAASLSLLPIGPRNAAWKPTSSDDPSLRILILLTVTTGGPYFLLSATAPLLQRWFTLSQPGKSPWRLYALSNLGSFLALLTYPFVIEPFLRLQTQVSIWSALYVAFALLCAATAWNLRSASSASPVAAPDPASKPSIPTVLFWLALSACASILLLATTSQISQEVAVNPFLWVAPLSIYLLTFILAFERQSFYRRPFFAVAAGLFAPAGCVILTAGIAISVPAQLALYLLTLFVTCMVCQGELALARPSAPYLTAFYLTIAAGGALGGLFSALIAPRAFTEFTEYPIGLAAVCLLALWGRLRTREPFTLTPVTMTLVFGAVTTAAAAVSISNQPTLLSKRNFYGILRVVEGSDAIGSRRELRHGRILHGFQYLQEPARSRPTAYFGPHSGAGLALNAINSQNRSIAVIGLGVGALAAWGRPGDTVRFYEINPDVETIARTWFSYLKDSPARTQVVLGDARVQLELELARDPSPRFDAIAVDAFSSDAIPVHLLTKEAGEIYLRCLRPGGLLLLHISNRTLDLEPVALGLAASIGARAKVITSESNPQNGEVRSQWAILTPGQEPLPATLTWTDDFASLWKILRF